MKKGLLIVGLIVVLIGGFLIGSYNGLASSRENIASAQADIDTMLQRRADLIPNLVSTVKSFAAHETEVYDAVLEARTQLMNASTMQDKADADAALDAALTQLNVVVEAYPELKSDTTYIGLMDELAGSENRISTARKDYNEVVRSYNQRIVTFPTSILANMFGFTKADYFEAAAGAATTPDVGALLGKSNYDILVNDVFPAKSSTEGFREYITTQTIPSSSQTTDKYTAPSRTVPKEDPQDL